MSKNVRFWFTLIIIYSDGKNSQQYFLCSKVVANVSLKPWRKTEKVPLLKYLSCTHPKILSDIVYVFLTIMLEFRKDETLPMFAFTQTQKSCLTALYKFAYRIAKKKKKERSNYDWQNIADIV